MIRWLLTSGDLLAKLVRFGFIGGLSGTIWLTLSLLTLDNLGVNITALVAGLGIDPVPASVAGYCASVPASFLGHRRFSFRSNGHWTWEAVRFVVAQALNIAVTAGSMHAAVHWFGSAWWWGMVAAVILVPIANFVFMNLWVFRNQQAG